MPDKKPLRSKLLPTNIASSTSISKPKPLADPFGKPVYKKRPEDTMRQMNPGEFERDLKNAPDPRPFLSTERTKERGDMLWNGVKKATALAEYVPIPLVRYPAMVLNGTMGAFDAYENMKAGNKDQAMMDGIGALPLPGMASVKTLKSLVTTGKAATKINKAANVAGGIGLFGSASDLTDNFGTQKQYAMGGLFENTDPLDPGEPQGFHMGYDEFTEEFDTGLSKSNPTNINYVPPVIKKKKQLSDISKFLKENPAEVATLGLGMLNNSLYKNQNDEEMAMRNGMSDSKYAAVAGNRGDYSFNEGYLRPDQKTVTQFNAIPKAAFGMGLIPDQIAPQLEDLKIAPSIPSPSLPAPGPAAVEPAVPKVVNEDLTIKSSPSNGSMKKGEKASFAFNFYKEQGVPEHVAAGIVGNLVQESNLDTGAVEKGNTGNGRGIAQWDKRNRWPAFLNWAKTQSKDPYELTTQLSYILVEPGEGQKALAKAAQTRSREEATIAFGRTYERPSEKYANWGHRIKVANRLESGGEISGDPREENIPTMKKYMDTPMKNGIYGMFSSPVGEDGKEIKNFTRRDILKTMAGYMKHNASDQSNNPSNVYRPEFQHSSMVYKETQLDTAAFGGMLEGDEVEMNEEQIKQFLRNGGEIEFLEDGGEISKMVEGGLIDYFSSSKKYAGAAKFGDNRKALAEQMGIKNYEGTAEQNIKLLGKIKEIDQAKPRTPEVKTAPLGRSTVRTTAGPVASVPSSRLASPVKSTVSSPFGSVVKPTVIQPAKQTPTRSMLAAPVNPAAPTAFGMFPSFTPATTPAKAVGKVATGKEGKVKENATTLINNTLKKFSTVAQNKIFPGFVEDDRKYDPNLNRAHSESTTVKRNLAKKFVPYDPNKGWERDDMNLDNKTREMNQRYVNSLHLFNYLPEGMDIDKKSVGENWDVVSKRSKEFNEEFAGSDSDKAYYPTKGAGTNLNKPGNVRRYDAAQNYFGLPQNTFIPSKFKHVTKDQYPTYQYKNTVNEEKYKKKMLESGFLNKFAEEEKAGKKFYSEGTHDTDNSVSNAHKLGVRRDEKGKVYMYYYDKWDLAANPADNLAGRVPNGIAPTVHKAVSKLQKPLLNGVEGKPFIVYNRMYLSDDEIKRYSKSVYKKLAADQNSHKDSE